MHTRALDSNGKVMNGDEEVHMFVQTMGKLLPITAIAPTTEAANLYCERYADDGVVADCGNFVLLANLHDKGVKI